ncbi:hypothetical protein BH10ACT11_BH10ACT11_10630 [soil metagenome]
MRLKAATATVLAVLVAVAPALADEVLGKKGGSTYVVARKTIVTHRGATIRTRCPRAGNAVGGGFASDTGKIVAKASAPYDGGDPGSVRDNGWKARLRAVAPDQGSVYAICRRQHYRFVRSVARRQEGEKISASVHCPAGTHVIAGGGFAAPSAHRLQSSYPIDSSDPGSDPDDGWRVTLARRSGTDDVHVYATCRQRRPFYAQSVGHIPRGLPLELEARCPPGRSVVGLGSRSFLHGTSVSLHTVAPLAGSKGGIPSRGTFVVVGKDGRQRIRQAAYAVCL